MSVTMVSSNNYSFLLHTMFFQLLSGTYQIPTKSLPNPYQILAIICQQLPGILSAIVQCLARRLPIPYQFGQPLLPISYYRNNRKFPDRARMLTDVGMLAGILEGFCRVFVMKLFLFCTKTLVNNSRAMLDSLLIGLNYRENIPDNYKFLDKWGLSVLFNPHSQENRGLLLASYPCSFR